MFIRVQHSVERLERWLQAWAAIADNIVCILSLAFLYPRLEMAVCVWRTKRKINRQ